MATPKSTKPATEKPAVVNTAAAAGEPSGKTTSSTVVTSTEIGNALTTAPADTNTTAAAGTDTTSSDDAKNTGNDRALTRLDAADLVGIAPTEVFHFVDLGDRVGVVTIDGRKLYADK